MMDKNIWMRTLFDNVVEMSNKEYQERIWLEGEGPDVSSFDEVINGFFDDFDINGFIDEYISKSSSIEADIAESLVNFRNDLDDYLKRRTEINDPKVILEDPEWERIRNKAKNVVNTWAPSIKQTGVASLASKWFDTYLAKLTDEAHPNST